jgi:Na+/H+-dicarboxylate symporter
MARTTINLVGNCLATAVMARCEGEFGKAALEPLPANLTETNPEHAPEAEDLV